MAAFRSLTDVIKHPILTEKSYSLIQNENTYTFAVHKEANKTLVREAITRIFDVKVVSVNIANTKDQKKRMGRYEGAKSGFKKAIVKLAPGQVIGGENTNEAPIKKEATTKAPVAKKVAPKAVKATKAAAPKMSAAATKSAGRGK